MTEVVLFLVAMAVIAFAGHKAHQIYYSRPRRFTYGDESYFMDADPDRGALDDIYEAMSYLYGDGTPVTDEIHIQQLRDYQKEEARRSRPHDGEI